MRYVGLVIDDWCIKTEDPKSILMYWFHASMKARHQRMLHKLTGVWA